MAKVNKVKEIAKLKKQLVKGDSRSLEQQYLRRRLRALGSYTRSERGRENIRQARLHCPDKENKQRGITKAKTEAAKKRKEATKKKQQGGSGK